jgi:hypothetical protein
MNCHNLSVPCCSLKNKKTTHTHRERAQVAPSFKRGRNAPFLIWSLGWGECFRFCQTRKEEMRMSKRTKTPTFVLELPLQVDAQQAKHLRAHFEAARCLYNALLGEAMKRLKQMRADPRWQVARRAVDKHERNALFSQLRQEVGIAEYALHPYATEARTSWIADHLDSNTAQKLATRAYQAVNRVCFGQARSVRFKSKEHGLSSVEGKSNTQGLRFVLQSPEEGNAGWLVWGMDRLPALIDWHDPVVTHGVSHRIKYVRLVRRRASSPQAQGADCTGVSVLRSACPGGRFACKSHTTTAYARNIRFSSASLSGTDIALPIRN